MNPKRFISLLAALLLASGISAFAASKPPVHVTETVFGDAVSLFDQRLFDEAEVEFKKVVSDSYRIDELLEIRLKSLQYLGFIERERNDYVHSNKWFKAATVNLKRYGDEDQKKRWGKVLSNEIRTNNSVIDAMRERDELIRNFQKKEIIFLSILLFITTLGLATLIVLFRHMRKTYKRLETRNTELADAIKEGTRVPEVPEKNPLYKKIVEYVEGSKAYLNPDFSLDDLCRAIGSNRTYVSSELNTTSARFNSFINGYRVKEAIRLFTEQPQLDIEDILEMSGFNAKTTFYTVFKDATGMSPAAFRKSLQGNNPNLEKAI